MPLTIQQVEPDVVQQAQERVDIATSLELLDGQATVGVSGDGSRAHVRVLAQLQERSVQLGVVGELRDFDSRQPYRMRAGLNLHRTDPKTWTVHVSGGTPMRDVVAATNRRGASAWHKMNETETAPLEEHQPYQLKL